MRYNTDFPPPSHSKLFLQVSFEYIWSCIASNFDKRWRGDHKHKIKDSPFMPKYGTVSQVFLQLVLAQGSSYSCSEGSSHREWTVYFHQNLNLINSTSN